MIKAVIFDLDGTAVDTVKCDFWSWQRFFSDHGIKLSFNDYKNFSGRKGIELIGELLKVNEKKANSLKGKRMTYFVECVKKNGIKIPEGLIEFLDSLINRYQTAIATASRRKRADFTLKLAGLKKYFTVIVSGDDVSKGKPDPELFLKAAEKLHCKPEECVVFEDALDGIKAAKNANMKCIAITTTHKKEQLQGAGRVIKSFKEIASEDLKNL